MQLPEQNGAFTIYYRGRGQQAPANAPIHPTPKVVIKVSTPFRYTSDKAVPWNYMNRVVSQEPQAIQVSLEKKQEPSVNLYSWSCTIYSTSKD